MNRICFTKNSSCPCPAPCYLHMYPCCSNQGFNRQHEEHRTRLGVLISDCDRAGLVHYRKVLRVLSTVARCRYSGGPPSDSTSDTRSSSSSLLWLESGFLLRTEPRRRRSRHASIIWARSCWSRWKFSLEKRGTRFKTPSSHKYLHYGGSFLKGQISTKTSKLGHVHWWIWRISSPKKWKFSHYLLTPVLNKTFLEQLR